MKNCYICNHTLPEELIFPCYPLDYNEVENKKILDISQYNKKNIKSDERTIKYVHLLCSSFFPELNLVFQNDELKYYTGIEKISFFDEKRECKMCGLGFLGSCLLKCSIE